jgi:NAD+ synthase (glutamine-hydrolysing)
VSETPALPLRLALAQTRLVVGDLAANAETVLRVAREANAAGVQLIAFPELTLTGYPPEDLVLRADFVDASAAATMALAGRLLDEGCGELTVVVGTLTRNEAGWPQNSAAVLHNGRIVAETAKRFLPNYGVWDERRYFMPGDDLLIIRVGDADIAITICEDIWWAGGRCAVAAKAGADLVLCINGSPFERGKDAFRRILCADRAAEAGAPVAYVNQIGGQDELVFDGGSLIVATDGSVVARSPQFAEDLLVADLTLTRHVGIGAGPVDGLQVHRATISQTPVASERSSAVFVADDLPDIAQVYEALVLGTRDYVAKNGFSTVGIQLSGGIDSALTATIAVDALGGGQVYTVALPSSYSSQHSLDDAEDLARRQGTQHRVVEIKPMVEAYQDALHLTGLAEENLQARVRGTLIMAISNADGHLVLATGNKSEIATGFSTLYGDSAGGYAPLKDVPKTLVWELSRWRNEQAVARGEEPPIPPNSIEKPPSAELAPGQLDADRLPPYDQLDALLEEYVEHDRSRAYLVDHGWDRETVEHVARLVDLAEFKRRQYPPGPKVSPKAFGRDRRLPITNRWRENS